MQRLDRVALIDDNDVDNYVHRIVLERCGLFSSVECFDSAEEALEYIQDPQNPRFELLFLDVNMPRMSGLDFVEAYRELPQEVKADAIILLLSTDLHTQDARRARELSEIRGFLEKPLKQEPVQELVEQLFVSSKK